MRQNLYFWPATVEVSGCGGGENFGIPLPGTTLTVLFHNYEFKIFVCGNHTCPI